MHGGGAQGLPHQIDPGAELVLVPEAVEAVIAQAVVQGQVRRQGPFVLGIEADRGGGARPIVDHRDRLVADLRAVGGQRDHLRCRLADGPVDLGDQARPQRVGGGQVIDALGLQPPRRVGLGRGLAEAVEQQAAPRIRGEIEGGIAREQGQLSGEAFGGLQIADHAEVGQLLLRLVQLGTVIGGPAVDDQRRGPRRADGDAGADAGGVGNLEPVDGAAEDQRHPAVGADHPFQIGKAVHLVGVVVQGRGAFVGALHPQVALHPRAGDEAVDVAAVEAVFEAGLDLPVGAAIDPHRPGILELRLGGDVHHPRGAQAVLGGQGPGDQRHLPRQPGAEGLAEHAEPFGQDHPVQPVLEAVVLPAHMQLAEAVLGHARGLQHHLVQGDIVPAGDVLDRLTVEGVDRRPQAGLDLVPGGVEPGVDVHRLHRGRGIGGRIRGGIGGRGRGRGVRRMGHGRASQGDEDKGDGGGGQQRGPGHSDDALCTEGVEPVVEPVPVGLRILSPTRHGEASRVCREFFPIPRAPEAGDRSGCIEDRCRPS